MRRTNAPARKRSKTNLSVLAISLGVLPLVPLAYAAPASAATDEYGNSFNIREKVVHVNGKKCATIHYSVNGWSAGWDADASMGSAYVTTNGVVGYEIESYDWWDWSSTGWDQLSWSGKRKVCAKEDKTVKGMAEFSVFPDSISDRDSYETVLTDTVRVDYHSVILRATNTRNAVKVKAYKDGKPFKSIKVSTSGITRRTDPRGVVTFPKTALPTGKRIVIKASDMASTKIKVSR